MSSAQREYEARGSHPESPLERELGDEFGRIAREGPTAGMISRSAHAAVTIACRHINARLRELGLAEIPAEVQSHVIRGGAPAPQ